MKLLRFITEEEYQKLIELSLKEELQSDNLRFYYHAENMKDNEDVKYINSVLKEVLEDFVSFSNFTKANPENIRVQWQWKTEFPSFTGVGWILIHELRDGFDKIGEEKWTLLTRSV